MDERAKFWKLSRVSLFAWVALCVLLATTCTSAYVPLGRGNLPLSLCIAAIKAVIIGAIFMQLSKPNAINRFAASAGLLWIFIMFVLMGSDYFTR